MGRHTSSTPAAGHISIQTASTFAKLIAEERRLGTLTRETRASSGGVAGGGNRCVPVLGSRAKASIRM